MASTFLVTHFHPRYVIFSGVAGALQKELSIGDVVISTKLFDVNFGSYTHLSAINISGLKIISPIKDRSTPLVFNVDSSLVRTIKRNIKTSIPVFYGPVATDQHFPSNPPIDILLQHDKVMAVAMEDKAIAQVCWNYNCSFVSVRGISDNIIKKDIYTDKTASRAARMAAAVTTKVVDVLSTH